MLPQDRSDDQFDQELVQEVRAAGNGDLRAFERLVEQHQRRIVADCRYMTRDAGSAEDLAQEVFVKVFFGLRSFEGRSSFRHWLQSIKVYHCLNHIRKNSAMRSISLEDAAPETTESLQVAPAAQREVEAETDRKLIEETLETLPPTLRIPLVMRDMDELSYDEIANSLGLGLSAVKMRIKRARAAFRARYREVLGETSKAAEQHA